MRLGSLAFSLVFLVSSLASADVTPPDVSACEGKALGAACKSTDAPAGICKDAKCTRRDYASWDRDASSSPPVVEFPCVKCVPPAATDAGAADGGASSDGGTSAPGGGSDTGSCSLAHRRAGSWALALVPALVLAFVERRRARRR